MDAPTQVGRSVLAARDNALLVARWGVWFVGLGLAVGAVTLTLPMLARSGTQLLPLLLVGLLYWPAALWLSSRWLSRGSLPALVALLVWTTLAFLRLADRTATMLSV